MEFIWKELLFLPNILPEGFGLLSTIGQRIVLRTSEVKSGGFGLVEVIFVSIQIFIASIGASSLLYKTLTAQDVLWERQDGFMRVL